MIVGHVADSLAPLHAFAVGCCSHHRLVRDPRYVPTLLSEGSDRYRRCRSPSRSTEEDVAQGGRSGRRVDVIVRRVARRVGERRDVLSEPLPSVIVAEACVVIVGLRGLTTADSLAALQASRSHCC